MTNLSRRLSFISSQKKRQAVLKDLIAKSKCFDDGNGDEPVTCISLCECKLNVLCTKD